MKFKLTPTYVVDHVTDINLQDLKDEGIKGLIFDLDNTLMAPKTGTITEKVSQWLVEAKLDFKMAVVSNNPHEKYLDQAYQQIGCPVYGKAKKPRRSITLKALKEMGLLPTEVAFVGDRPLTDIWVGQRLKMTTILVDPIIKHEEIEIVKFLRKMERIFIKAPKKIFTEIKNNQK